MIWQTGQQIIKNILPNISRNKHNEVMEFGQLKKYSVRNFFFGENHAENEADKLVPDPLLFFEKALFKVKVVIYFGIP